MARLKRRVFEQSGPFVARIAFPFNGRMYTAGEPFVEDLPLRKLRILYDARRIEFDEKAVSLVTTDDSHFNWKELSEEELLAYAYEQTGTRFRKVERAIRALEDIC